ncbi:MAG: imidazole glycerol phosphate synthase subunit HisH [bacterium]
MNKIAVIDYGMGNLHSVMKALQYEKIPAVLTDNPEVIKKCSGIILPGVGAFQDAMAEIEKRKLKKVLIEEVLKGKPLLGICLGMQLLFSYSSEFGRHKGLGFVPGNVVRFNLKMKVPHIGWNEAVIVNKGSKILKGIKNSQFFYFVHSYYCVPLNKKAILTKTQYGNIIFTSAVELGNVFGFQFHPEKSTEAAMVIYKNFYKICIQRKDK